MKLEIKKQVMLTHEEYLRINKALDVLRDMASNRDISIAINSQLPYGFNVENIRDGLQHLDNIVEI